MPVSRSSWIRVGWLVRLIRSLVVSRPAGRFTHTLSIRHPHEPPEPDPDETAAVLHGVLLGPIAPTIDQRRAITAPALVLGHGIDLIHSFADEKRLARQLPDARLIRTRTFAELWVHPARLTAEISEFLDRVWADDEPRNRAEVS